jgi:hypothetical protein
MVAVMMLPGRRLEVGHFWSPPRLRRGGRGRSQCRGGVSASPPASDRALRVTRRKSDCKHLEWASRRNGPIDHPRAALRHVPSSSEEGTVWASRIGQTLAGAHRAPLQQVFVQTLRLMTTKQAPSHSDQIQPSIFKTSSTSPFLMPYARSWRLIVPSWYCTQSSILSPTSTETDGS